MGSIFAFPNEPLSSSDTWEGQVGEVSSRVADWAGGGGHVHRGVCDQSSGSTPAYPGALKKFKWEMVAFGSRAAAGLSLV